MVSYFVHTESLLKTKHKNKNKKKRKRKKTHFLPENKLLSFRVDPFHAGGKTILRVKVSNVMPNSVDLDHNPIESNLGLCCLHLSVL